MMEYAFRIFLQKEGKTEKAIDTRITRLNKIESTIGNVDLIVSNNETMKRALCIIKNIDCVKQPLSNALRRYYKFKNKTDFPQMRYVL